MIKLKISTMKKNVRECKKLRSLIQKVVKSNTSNIYQTEYDDSSMEYGKIIKEYVISKGNEAKTNEVWNVYTIQKVPDPYF